MKNTPITLLLALGLSLAVISPTVTSAQENQEVVEETKETNCTTSGAYGQDESCTETTTKKVVIRDGKVLGAHTTVNTGFGLSFIGLPLIAVGLFMIAKKAI